MVNRTKRPSKTPRAREYTGPNTLEDVKKFWLTNPTKKAMEQAAKSLSVEDQVELAKWAIQFGLDAMKKHRQIMDAEWKRRGYDIE